MQLYCSCYIIELTSLDYNVSTDIVRLQCFNGYNILSRSNWNERVRPVAPPKNSSVKFPSLRHLAFVLKTSDAHRSVQVAVDPLVSDMYLIAGSACQCMH